MAQLTAEIRRAQLAGEDALLVVHGYGASGVGGAIKEAVTVELPGLADRYRFRIYRQGERDRLPESLQGVARGLSPGSTLLVFPPAKRDKQPAQDFRPNFRTLRKRVIVRRRRKAN